MKAFTGPSAGAGSASSLRNSLVPTSCREDIEASYRDMAADQAREQEALEWSEGVIADSSPREPHASR